MKKAFLLALAIIGLPCALHAQVSINPTGATPDASAMLDVGSTTKGLLPPRMTEAQRTAIATPATGLVVYQTDAPVGLYCNNGTPATPLWQQLAPRVKPAYGTFYGQTNQTVNFGVVNYYDFVGNYEVSGLTFSAAADAVTIVTPGLYKIYFSLNFSLAGSGQGSANLQINSTNVGQQSSPFSSQANIPATQEGIYSLNAGDVVTLRVGNINGGTVRIITGSMTVLQVY